MSTLDSTHFLPTKHPPMPDHRNAPRPLKATSAAVYVKALRHFSEVFGGQVPCDRAAVERYIAAQRNKAAPTTIYLRIQALRHEHLRLGHPSPTDLPEIRPLLRQLQKGILPPRPGAKAAPSTKPREPRHVKPITRSLLAKILDAMGTDLLDRRDRGLLLLGFSAALSRSSLAALNLSDLEFSADVMIVHLRDQNGSAEASRTVTCSITGAELCAATAIRDYIRHAALDLEGDGPLFRSCDRASALTKHRLGAAYISVVVKSRLRDVGVDAANFSGLSLKRGRLMEVARGVL